MRKKKMAVTMMLAASLSCAQVMTSLASWQQDEKGWWYQYDNGNYAAQGLATIGDSKYLFDANGYMLTGWQLYNNRWYYLAEDGHMVFGWIEVDGKWYYLGDQGFMLTGWVKDGDKSYYLNTDGSLKIGSFEVDGTWYSTDSKGAAITNKLKKNKNESSATLWSDADGSIFRYNELEKDWEYLPGKEESAELMMKKLFDDYLSYGNTEDFEAAARENLRGLLPETKIEEFINDMEQSYMFDYEEDENSYGYTYD